MKKMENLLKLKSIISDIPGKHHGEKKIRDKTPHSNI